MKNKILLFLVLISCQPVIAQTTFNKYFGGSIPTFIDQNPDGSYIAGFDSATQISVLHLSPCGDVIFYKSYHMGTMGSDLTSITHTYNGYIVSGSCRDSVSFCEMNAFYLQLNYMGDSISSKKFDCDSEWGSYGGPVLATSDSNFIFRYFIDAAGISNYSRIIKTNTNDSIFWTAQGGNDWTRQTSSMKLDSLNYLLHIYSNDINGYSYTGKIDPLGQTLYSLSIVDTNFVDFYASHSVTASTDGGILTGGTVAGEVYILKADSALDSLWTKRYSNYSIEPVDIMNDADSGYFLLINNSTQGFDLFHINSSGDSLNTITYSSTNPVIARCINKCIDGGFIIIAQTTDSISNLPTSLILKTNSDGFVENDTLIVDAAICQGSNYILPDGTLVTNAGSYSTTITNSFGCYSITRTNLSLHTNPVVQVNADPIRCYGDSTAVVVSASGGTPPYVGTGTFNYPAGNYSTVITDNNSCSDSLTITLAEPPPLIADAGLPSAICPGDFTMLGGAPTGSGGTGLILYQWSPSSNLSSSTAANPLAGLQLTETFEVIVTDSNGCTSISDVTITVGSNASPTILQTGDSLYTTTSASLYHWYLSGFLIWSSNLPYMIATQSGDYQLIVSDSIGCEGVSATVPIVVTAVSESHLLDEVSIFPNPTNNLINIRLTQQLPDAIITIYDITGKEVVKTPCQEQSLQINLSNLTSGIYIVELQSPKFTSFHRLVFQK